MGMRIAYVFQFFQMALKACESHEELGIVQNWWQAYILYDDSIVTYKIAE